MSGTAVPVSANATDNVGVVGVQFLLDGVALGAEDSAAPWTMSWNSTTALDGIHQLAARARDAAGNQATSVPVVVIVANGATPPPDPDPDGSPNPDPDETAPSQGVGTMELTVEPSTPGFRQIRANADATGVEQLEIYIDGQLTATVPGSSAVYDWDVRPLVGAHEIRVAGLDVSGTEVFASSSLFYSPASVQVPSVTLDVVEFGIVGATFIRALADVTGVGRLELYIDGELRLAELGEEIEYAWTPEPGVTHQILFAAYDSTGVAASVSVSYGP